MSKTHVLALLLSVATVGLSPTVQAQEKSQEPLKPIRVYSVTETIDKAFFFESKDFYENRTSFRQFQFLFGADAKRGAVFPEMEIERDGKLMNTLYNDMLYQQSSSDPIIRTPDLPNPYNSSLRMMPNNRYNSRVVGSELVFEKAPLR
jgi:hypothetical protein